MQRRLLGPLSHTAPPDSYGSEMCGHGGIFHPFQVQNKVTRAFDQVPLHLLCQGPGAMTLWWVGTCGSQELGSKIRPCRRFRCVVEARQTVRNWED